MPKTKPPPDAYKLGSADLIHSPGIYRFALHGYKTGFPPGPDYFIGLIHEGWSVPKDVIKKAFDGKLPVDIDDLGASVTIHLNIDPNPNKKGT